MQAAKQADCKSVIPRGGSSPSSTTHELVSFLVRVELRSMNTRQMGDVGVAAAIYYYTKLGYTVSLPITESTRYDLIVDIDGDLKRVQCKTGSYMNQGGTSYKIQLATSGGNRSWNGTKKMISSEEVDLVFIRTSDGTLWEVPVDVVAGKGSFTASSINGQYVVEGSPLSRPLPKTSVKITKSGSKMYGKRCLDCQETVSYHSLRCRACDSLVPRPTKVTWPEDEDLLDMYLKSSFLQVGRTLGVSDNAVRKRLKSRGLLT